jgi:endonuclease/exonuclease/phosphatase family metal-dependent hydrolase
VGQGEFWFSESPKVPGSKSWDSSLPRMTAWVDLGFDASNRSVRIYGTHYDHRGSEARLRASEMIVAHAEGLERVIVMGDLNARAENPPVKVFLDDGFESAVSTALPDETRGTFNGFRDETGGGRGRRIDFVLLRGALQAESAAILGGRVQGLFPSDHDAVTASVVLLD